MPVVHPIVASNYLARVRIFTQALLEPLQGRVHRTCPKQRIAQVWLTPPVAQGPQESTLGLLR